MGQSNSGPCKRNQRGGQTYIWKPNVHKLRGHQYDQRGTQKGRTIEVNTVREMGEEGPLEKPGFAVGGGIKVGPRTWGNA